MTRSLATLALAAFLGGCSSSTPPAPPASPAASTPTPEAVAAAGNPSDKQKLFEQNCSACHSADGTGVSGLGKPLVGSPMLKLSDAELVAFIIKGRAPGEKGNTTGVAMPPKGGNPALTDANLQDIVSYIRTLK